MNRNTGAILGLLCVGFALLALLVLAPGRALANLEGLQPISLHSGLNADYSADPLDLQLAPVALRAAEQSLVDRAAAPAQAATALQALSTPVPSVTPQRGGTRTPTATGGVGRQNTLTALALTPTRTRAGNTPGVSTATLEAATLTLTPSPTFTLQPSGTVTPKLTATRTPTLPGAAKTPTTQPNTATPKWTPTKTEAAIQTKAPTSPPTATPKTFTQTPTKTTAPVATKTPSNTPVPPTKIPTRTPTKAGYPPPSTSVPYP